MARPQSKTDLLMKKLMRYNFVAKNQELFTVDSEYFGLQIL